MFWLAVYIQTGLFIMLDQREWEWAASYFTGGFADFILLRVPVEPFGVSHRSISVGVIAVYLLGMPVLHLWHLVRAMRGDAPVKVIERDVDLGFNASRYRFRRRAGRLIG